MTGAPGGGGGDEPPPPRTEDVNPRTADLDLLSGAALAARVFAEDTAVALACARAARDVGRLVDAAGAALEVGGRLVYVGAGTSGRLALLDAVELAPTFSLEEGRVVALLAGGEGALFRAREGAEDVSQDGARAVLDARVGPLDVVVGVTASGRTPFTLGAVAAAARRGARTALVVCSPPPREVPVEIVVLLETGPEVLAGSTRMKAGSATKMVLNAVSLGAMARIGKIHGNRMVDVRVTSEKLRRRARGLVVDLAGVEPATADRLLAAAGAVRPAVVMARFGCDLEGALARLAAASGSLRTALAADGEGAGDEAGPA